MISCSTPSLIWYFPLLALILLSCAGQVPPQGGALDTTPPEIISTYPRNFSTGFHDRKIVLEFDEYVDRRSVSESIFISPYVGHLEFDWSGREVEITFSDSLRQNTTYVVNIGTDVVDLRNRNRMAHSFTLAFSTGVQIDRGMIQGKVFPMKVEDASAGVMIFAYKLEGRDPDTLNPRSTKPDYVTQTGKIGAFELRHIALGPYRVLAVRDEFRNLLYDPESDEYGVPSFPILLTEQDTLGGNVLMQLTKEDTTAPRLIRVAPLNRNLLLAEFSEPIDTSVVHVNVFQMTDTVNATKLAVRSASPNLSKMSEVLLETEEQSPDVGYRLSVDGIRDLAGLGINPLAKSLAFTGSGVPDTTKLVLASVSVKDSAKGVELQPTFQIVLSKPVEEVAAVASLLDSKAAILPSSVRWIGRMSLEVKPSLKLSPKTWYALCVDMTKPRDSRVRAMTESGGQPARDSVWMIHFETLDDENLSSIEGTLVDRNNSDTTGGFILEAHTIAQKDFSRYELFLPKQGPFKFDDILHGTYVIKVFRDRNGNKKYDVGLPFSYQPSERFSFYPDTLKLRARWPLEGVKIELR